MALRHCGLDRIIIQNIDRKGYKRITDKSDQFFNISARLRLANHGVQRRVR